VRQVMPQVLAQARRTITGRGGGDGARGREPVGRRFRGPSWIRGVTSEYFANAALKAAKDWKFAPAESPRTWILRSSFKRAGTTVAATESEIVD